MSDERMPDVFDVVLHKYIIKCSEALDRIKSLTDQDRNYFRAQIEHDFYNGLHLVDPTNPANPTIDNMLDNRTKGIQSRAQLARYLGHFNECITKLSNSGPPIIDFAGLENENVPDRALAGFTGTVYKSTYSFQGDVNNSGPMSLNWFSLKYDPEDTPTVNLSESQKEYLHDKERLSTEVLNTCYFLSEEHDRLIEKQRIRLEKNGCEWNQRTLSVDDTKYAVFFPMSMTLMRSEVPYEAIRRSDKKTPDQLKGTFDGWAFAGLYVEAYKSGMSYFLDEFKPKAKDFHGENAKELAAKIWRQYTEIGYKERDGNKGWVYAKSLHCWSDPV